MKDLKRFYTYAYLREDRTPYYIGKGEKDRIYKKKKNEIQSPKDKTRIIFLKQNLTEEEAFRHEVYMIAVFGRKDLGTGILRNKTDGGEGASGAVRSEETKKKISNFNKGKKQSPHTNEAKYKISEYAKNRPKEHNEKISKAKKGRDAHNKGKKMSQEQKNKLIIANTGKKHTEETKRKISIKSIGRTHSEEAKEKIRKNRKGILHCEETRLMLSEINTGKKWWNDGFGNTKFSKENPGFGWSLGRGTIKKLS